MTDVSGTNMTYTGDSVTVSNNTYSGTLQKADDGKQAEIQNTLASKDGVMGNVGLDSMGGPEDLK